MRDFLWVGCEKGHDWISMGGKNASCDTDACGCSVPVNECSRCGECDYGDNEDADEVRKYCELMR